MAIRVEWDDLNHTKLKYIYEGSWNWDEFQKARKQAVSMMDSVDYKIDVIIDIAQSGVLPNNILSRASSILRERHPREKTTIVIGASPLIRFLYDVARRIYAEVIDNRGYYIVSNLEEARRIADDHLDRSTRIQ
ncbi:MAG: hypothetical protein JNM70_13580 [Anaerolineae bacterium]|nr:hypothetical protein [Anaerolineae bacterium]